MWLPPTNVWSNHDSRSVNHNTGRPSNVSLIGMILRTHKSRQKYFTHQSRQKVSYVPTKLSHN